MSQRLSEKIALVTGGGSGLGAAICKRFAEEGAIVFPADVNEGAAKTVSAECEKLTAGGAPLAVDVADSGSVRRMFGELGKKTKRLDVLVNNAGIALKGARAARYVDLMMKQAQELAAKGRIETHCDVTQDLSDEDWDRMLRVHLYGTFYCSREALKLMSRQNGGLSAGKIINVGSIMGTAAGAGAIDYCAAKAGILGFTRALAREVASRNIQVNALAPGFVDTPLLDDMHAAYPLVAAATPLGRLGLPDDIAWAAVYLASSESDWVTGQTLSPNGGWHMSQ
ncbi:MAG TPA: SDR family oxidoreductase [Candidatus Binatia bacterium]|nr:SDR family oxidoreductase [Candidatus Binatia bacterium]